MDLGLLKTRFVRRHNWWPVHKTVNSASNRSRSWISACRPRPDSFLIYVPTKSPFPLSFLLLCLLCPGNPKTRERNSVLRPNYTSLLNVFLPTAEGSPNTLTFSGPELTPDWADSSCQGSSLLQEILLQVGAQQTDREGKTWLTPEKPTQHGPTRNSWKLEAGPAIIR